MIRPRKIVKAWEENTIHKDNQRPATTSSATTRSSISPPRSSSASGFNESQLKTIDDVIEYNNGEVSAKVGADGEDTSLSSIKSVSSYSDDASSIDGDSDGEVDSNKPKLSSTSESVRPHTDSYDDGDSDDSGDVFNADVNNALDDSTNTITTNEINSIKIKYNQFVIDINNFNNENCLNNLINYLNPNPDNSILSINNIDILSNSNDTFTYYSNLKFDGSDISCNVTNPTNLSVILKINGHTFNNNNFNRDETVAKLLNNNNTIESQNIVIYKKTITDFIKNIGTPDELYILINNTITIHIKTIVVYTIFKVKVNKQTINRMFRLNPTTNLASIEVMELNVYRLANGGSIDIENPVFEYSK